MPSVRRVLLPLVVVAALAGAACGDPPDKEIQQAQTAIDAAKSAGADTLAHDEFAAAETALARAHEAVGQRDYRQALNQALDARERAQVSLKDATTRKTAAQADARRALTAADQAVAAARGRLKAAETGRVAPRTLANARREIANADEDVQKARTALAADDVKTVLDLANQVTARMDGVSRDLHAALVASARRRH
jgi:hypothetical protein